MAKLFAKRLMASPDIPFRGDESNRFLPWIVAFLMCLTTLMLAASLTLNLALHRWDGNYLNRFTIQIPQPDDAEKSSANARPENILRLVEENEWVEEANLLGQKELQDLIEPWLGDADIINSLPLPYLIEVRVKPDTAVDIPALQARLAKIAPGTEIDDYKLWMDKFSRFSKSVQLVAFGLSVLLVLTLLGIVVLLSKTALRLHQRTVDVLYTIGAKDDYIARQFQRNAMRQVLKGAVFGTAVAVAMFIFLGKLAAELESSLLPPFTITMGHVLLFGVLPLLTAFAARWTTRAAVLSLLKQRP